MSLHSSRTGVALAVLALAVTSLPASAACLSVMGQLSERALAADCSSPVGVCTEGTLSGSIQGQFVTVVSALTPTADTPITGVVMVTANTAVQGKLGRRQGQVFTKNAAALRTVSPGHVADLHTIVGGTGDFAGATGSLTVFGTYDGAAGSGTSAYVGTVCLP